MRASCCGGGHIERSGAGRAAIVGFGVAKTYVTHYDHQARFYYDADGARVVSINDGARAVYIGDWVETGASYYFLGGQRMAKRATGGVTYLHGDHLGSTAKTTGAASSAQLYDAYGAKRGSSEVDTPYRYTGQRWEENDALDIYYYKARWYDPQLGRFLQPDPFVPEAGNPQNLNRYSYCLGNPLRFIDPSGLFTEDELLGYGFSQEQIDAWKQDTAWWDMLFNAQLFDIVRGARRFTGGVGPIGGWFTTVSPEKVWAGERLVLDGYRDLESYRQESKNWQLWRYSGGEFSQVRYATMRAAPSAAWEAAEFAGYRPVVRVSWNPDWDDVAWDIASIGAMHLGTNTDPRVARFGTTADTIINGIQAGRTGSDIIFGTADVKDYFTGAAMLAGMALESQYPIAPKIGAAVSLAIDLGPDFAVYREEIWR